ncbi:hypothetical protein H072_9023 [Dactylellina haptotyla CBS 200.50]|uniref:Uncharacterized protein n=1 Tax=Dactylellina haptotyla (strain CBS 200.50) TaxID=1284197 RepID=S8A2R8_DACHA|nr:hypothetical protein H072_9023 [Dactylellina haptotyla CBS 200.50]
MADRMSPLAWTESLKTRNIGASLMNTEEESLYTVSGSSATETYLDYDPGKNFKELKETPVDSERMSLDYLTTKGGRYCGLGASVGICDRHMPLDPEIEKPLMHQLPAFDTRAQGNTELPKASHKEDLAMCDSGWAAIALSNTKKSKISFQMPIGGPAETMRPEPQKGPSQTRPLAAPAASRQVHKNCKKTAAQLRLRTSLEATLRNASFQGHSSGLESNAPLLPPCPPNLTKPRKGEVWIEDIGAESKVQANVTSFEFPSEDWEVVDEMEGYEQDERDWAAVKELDRDIPKC